MERLIVILETRQARVAPILYVIALKICNNYHALDYSKMYDMFIALQKHNEYNQNIFEKNNRNENNVFNTNKKYLLKIPL